MAMLRNLRNMIQAGISEKHHRWVIGKLTDEVSFGLFKNVKFRTQKKNLSVHINGKSLYSSVNIYMQISIAVNDSMVYKLYIKIGFEELRI